MARVHGRRRRSPAYWLLCLLLAPFLNRGSDAFTSTAGPVHVRSIERNGDRRLRRPHYSIHTRCQLFYKSVATTTEERALTQNRQDAQAKIPSWALEALSCGDTTLPFQFALRSDSSYYNDDGDTTTMVNIRMLEFDDLPIIVPMCTAEFGGSEASIADLLHHIPWEEPSKITKVVREWLENASLPAYIYWTFWFKIAARNPNDHALLIATLQQQQQQQAGDNNNNNSMMQKETLVGMVELSQQPPDPHRNPTAYPLPLWYKQGYCLVHNLPPINGWITNLLVDPEFRSRGFSKLLMAAAEGVARSWDCTQIHLHCDADTVAGKVPQRLYQRLGYEMVEDPHSPFSWMGSEFSNKIYMVQGVALLYMRKELALSSSSMDDY